MFSWLSDAKKQDAQPLMPRNDDDKGCIRDPLPKSARDIANEYIRKQVEDKVSTAPKKRRG